MASQDLQPCLVCGEKTKNRCSACQAAGIDLFFCSREHQKLVWPVHKLVCGPGKANPFLWPALSQQEVDEILSNAEYKPVLDGESARSAVEATLMRLTVHSDSVRQHAQQNLIFELRFTNFQRTVARAPDDQLRFTPLQFATSLAVVTDESPSSSMSWYTPLCHRLLVFAAVSDRGNRAALAGGDAKMKDLCWQSLHQLLKYVKTSVAPTAPKAASSLFDMFADLPAARGRSST
ncbi:hypothetical protein JCM10449v2_003449 [Rhodotorula kratochvilovae]